MPSRATADDLGALLSEDPQLTITITGIKASRMRCRKLVGLLFSGSWRSRASAYFCCAFKVDCNKDSLYLGASCYMPTADVFHEPAFLSAD